MKKSSEAIQHVFLYIISEVKTKIEKTPMNTNCFAIFRFLWVPFVFMDDQKNLFKMIGLQEDSKFQGTTQ